MNLRRVGIRAKLTGIYGIIALPLTVALALSFAARYQESVANALGERQEIARVAGSVLVSNIEALGVSMTFIGQHGLVENRGPAEIASELRALGETFPVTQATLLDRSGEVAASTRSSLEGENLSEIPEVDAVLSGDIDLTVSDVTRSAGELGFNVVQVVPDADGEVLGAVVGFVSLGKLHDTAPVALRTGNAHIVDSAGRLVYNSSDADYVTLDIDWGDVSLIRRALDGQDAAGAMRQPVTGETVLDAEVPIRAFGWAAGSDVARSGIVAPIRNQLVAFGLVLLAVQILVITFVTLASRQLVGPLSELVEEAEEVGEGRFGRPISVNTGDEIQTLAEAMDGTRRKLKRYVEGLDALSQNARSLTATVEREALDRAIISGATELFGATEVWILIEREGRLVPRLLHGTDIDAATLGEPSAQFGVLADVIRGGLARIIPDVRELPPTEWARRAATRDIRSVALLPLRSRTATYGLIGIAAPQTMRWAEERRERELLDIFAGQVADALENAGLFMQVQRLAEDNERLYERERDAATRLQESLLRLPSAVHGVHFHHLYRSASQATLVGGDFYDLFDLGSDRLGISVGDVSGKGLEAATLISFVKSSVRAYAYEGHSPADVVASVDDSVGKLSEPEDFVTVFFGVFECVTGRLVYCSAGHPQAIIRRAGPPGGDIVESLETTSPVLGAFLDAEFANERASLQPGDTLLLYTDGVTEARDPKGGFFGSERLVEVVRQSSQDDDLTRVVFARISEFSGGRLGDDVAMIALTPESRACELPG